VTTAANPPESAPSSTSPPRQNQLGALLVAAGILLSRVLGVVRESLKARYLGASNGIAADAFNAAFRIPNLLQNLFGEGALSASFIPVYANLLARGQREDADKVAGAVAGLLALVVSIIVLLGVLFTPQLLFLIAPGFSGDKRALTITITRILFPGAGLFVLSAWCLGVLNSHRKFFLSYSAPVVWNLAMIVTLIAAGRRADLNQIAIYLAWGSVVGAALMFLVQLPVVLRLTPSLRVSIDRTQEGVRTVVRNFFPVFVSRGVVQISAFVDQLLASLLPNGMVSLLFYAQTINVLPVSLFGMSVAAAELPEMASTVGGLDEQKAHLRARLNTGLRQIAFFVVPSAMAFLLFGDVMAAALFQHGRFTRTDTIFTWGVLAGSAVGLLASTLGRLYSSAYYALGDTRTPLRFALLRVGLTTLLGYLFAIPLPRLLGIDPRWGAAGLTASAGLAGWVEFSLLRSRMNRRVGGTGLPVRVAGTLWGLALIAGAVGWGARLVLVGQHRILVAVGVLGAFGIVYVALTYWSGIAESRSMVRRVVRR
jgi:putative peptidoglycan lipid II flippase